MRGPASAPMRPAWAGRPPCAMPCAAHSEGWRLSASDHAPLTGHRSPVALLFDNTEGSQSRYVVSNMSSPYRCSKLPSAVGNGGCFFDYTKWGTHGGPEFSLPTWGNPSDLGRIHAGQGLFTNVGSSGRLRQYPPVSSAVHGNRGACLAHPSLCVCPARPGVRYTRCSALRAGSHTLRSAPSRLRSVGNPHNGE
jgi:hypothetical protein